MAQDQITWVPLGLFAGAALSIAACGEQTPPSAPTPETEEPAADTTAGIPAPAPPATDEHRDDATEAAAPVTSETEIVLVMGDAAPTDRVLSAEGSEIVQLVAFGVEHPAASYCNESTRINPDELVVYEVAGRPERVFHCPGSLDGDTNVVTIVQPGAAPITETIQPDPSSHIAELDAVTALVKRLLVARDS